MPFLRALVLLAIGCAAAPALAQGPSFDCRKARSADEIAICNDADLAQLDRLTALAYDEARRVSGPAAARGAARQGLGLRSSCGSDPVCIMSAQVATLQRLQQLGASVSVPDWAVTDAGGGAADDGSQYAGGLPSAVGECVHTEIVEITSRFQADINADPDDGSAVSFANGGHQVSYDKELPIIRSRVGDPVLMCLVSIPDHCPPGDDRGRIYTTTNLRTQQTWTLPDSQHSCGGA